MTVQGFLTYVAPLIVLGVALLALGLVTFLSRRQDARTAKLRAIIAAGPDPVRQNHLLREAHRVLFERYLEKLAAFGPGSTAEAPSAMDDKASFHHLHWLCLTALEGIEIFPIDKLSRWLGFVQGVMTSEGYLRVDEERDFSRPLFHAAYGRSAPPTHVRPQTPE